MPISDSERVLRAQIAAHTGWANTIDRTARTQPGRDAMDAKFLALAGGDPRRAEQLKKAHFKRLALKSATARRRAKENRAEAAAAERELNAAGDAA